MKYPESVEKLIQCFEAFPGIGIKSAERMAIFMLSKMSKEEALGFSKAIEEVVLDIKKCPKCGLFTDQDLCEVCSDDTRQKTIMIVENSKDVLAFEKVGIYKGQYHVLDGCISPLNGVGPDDINLESLFSRIKKDMITEIILALPSTISGEMTALYIKKMLEKSAVKVFRIGYGLPVGADIEYADEITLTKALEGKREI